MSCGQKWWYAAGPALLALTLYWRVYSFDFTNLDDSQYVTTNAHVCGGLSPESIWWALTAVECANWHPLTWWSLQLDHTLYGSSPAGYHVTNLGLHLANTVLLFWVFQNMTGAVVRSVVLAALFAVHPLHVESVAWVSERKDVLSTFFWLLTMLAYGRYVARPSPGRYGQVVATFVLGLAAKPMLVTLPCVLLLLDFWPLGRWRWHGATNMEKGERRQKSESIRSNPKSEIRNPKSGGSPLTTLIAEKLPLLVLSAACSLITLSAQSKGGTIAAIDRLPLADRLINAVGAYVTYLKLAVCPINLAAFYPQESFRRPLLATFVEAAALLGVTYWVYRRRKRQGYLLVGWLWYLGTLVPVIGLVQVGVQAIADRYTYVPLIGVFLAVVWGVGDLQATGAVSRRFVATLASVALIGYNLLTWTQVGYWRDSVSLWQRAIEVTGPNFPACARLGKALLDRGQAGEALPCLRQAAGLLPGDAEVHAFLGLALFQLGDRARSRLEYETVVRIEPRYAAAHRMLGALSQKDGDLEQAATHLRNALEVDANDWQAHWGLGEVLVELGVVDEGQRHLNEAARLNPRLAKRPD